MPSGAMEVSAQKLASNGTPRATNQSKWPRLSSQYRAILVSLGSGPQAAIM